MAGKQYYRENIERHSSEPLGNISSTSGCFVRKYMERNEKDMQDLGKIIMDNIISQTKGRGGTRR
ncbi:MAG: hypothetical protein LBH34_05020 [Prevotellaceae bacterium]|jgi:hypothetical protein|nr:hypothetical protein [Prevotellaceae bacterium]